MKPPTEKAVEAWVIDLFRKCGLLVWKTSQPRASMITEGLFDLWVFCPRRKLAFWWEVKRPGGKLSPVQRRFLELCRECGVRAYVGGLDEARALLDELEITLKLEARPFPVPVLPTPRSSFPLTGDVPLFFPHSTSEGSRP